jgi:hypothetical protein
MTAMQEFARQQAAAVSFDYRRLTDEFRERLLKECRARQVTPLIKQQGILVITDRGLYFQPLHNVAGGAVVKFHPAAAITCLARRRIAMRPTALEVFLTASTSSHFMASDQVRPDTHAMHGELCMAALELCTSRGMQTRKPCMPTMHTTDMQGMQAHRHPCCPCMLVCMLCTVQQLTPSCVHECVSPAR